MLYTVFMEENEPKINPGSCSYCGNAPISHAFSFLEGLVSVPLDHHGKKVIRNVPSFVKKFADIFPEFLFRTFVFLRVAKFSKDISKARTFRSKIIWEEARKRGIEMEQVIFLDRPLDQYRAKVNGKSIYFESIPIRPEFLDMDKNWDDKLLLKRELAKQSISVPEYYEVSLFSLNRNKNIEKIFAKLSKPVIVKPRVGSRGRHTITNINTLSQLKAGIKEAGKICPYLIVEEELKGPVCRATVVNGQLAGFYTAQTPVLLGDGKRTIRELILEVDQKRGERIEPIRLGEELFRKIERSGFRIDDVLPRGASITLTHRMGRLFGGSTKEMIDSLHPSFVPIFLQAAKVTGLSVVGFDAIIPDPTKGADTQRWGIIECNTLPFIDLHYFALEGKPRNIAGMIWDMWN